MSVSASMEENLRGELSSFADNHHVGSLISGAGGAGFWVAVHDNGGTWSSEVNQALTTSRGCSGSYTQATNTGGGGGITTGTVAATTTAGNSGGGGGCSCPASYTGLYPVNDCKSFVHCSNGSPSSAWIDCQAGLLFDASQQVCNWAALVTCACDGGGAPATTTTTTITQQQTPSTTSTSTTTSSTVRVFLLLSSAP